MLLTHEEVPPLLKRKHILEGYRPLNQPTFFYFLSAFRLHNELLNVWTHFVPALFLLYFYMIPELTSEHPRTPVIVLHVAILILLIGSSSAHLFHSKSPLNHVFWYLIDFSGIAIFGLAIGLQRFACCMNMGLVMNIAYVPLLMTVVLGMQFFSSCYLFVHKPHWKWRLELRMGSCFLLACWLFIPLYARYYVESADQDSGLHLHTRAFQWLMISGIFMGAHIPERFAPGLFDIVGYGHQLFHLCINMVAWNLLDSADLDCDATESKFFSWKNITITVSFVGSIAFIMYTVRKLMQRAFNNKYD